MFEVESCVCGFHVNKELWTPYVGENLRCIRESGNRDDPFAVAVKHGNDTVGHLPRKVSCICSLFLRYGRSISCTVMGDKRRGTDLPQGPQRFEDKGRIRFIEIEGKQAPSDEIVASRNDDKDRAQVSGKSVGKSQQEQLKFKQKLQRRSQARKRLTLFYDNLAAIQGYGSEGE